MKLQLLNIKKIYQLSNTFILITLLCIPLTACLTPPWPKSKLNGKPLETQLDIVEKDQKENPEQIIPRKNLLVTQELAVTQLMLDADKAKDAGQYYEASHLYDRVLELLPGNQRALNGKAIIDKALENEQLIQKAEKLLNEKDVNASKSIVHKVLIQNPNHKGALSLQKQLSRDNDNVGSEPIDLKLPFDKPVTLELRDTNIKVVFEALSRVSGINFILDKDIKPDTKATIFVKKARIEDAIELVLSSNGLQKKVLTENTVLIYPNTQKKLQSYQDLLIRSFYLSNTSAKQISSLFKTILKAKDVFLDERLNMVTIRDTPETIRIAEKLIVAYDLEDPEVMLEIEILEISRNRLQELGIEYPSRLSVTTTPLTLRALREGIPSDQIGVTPNPAVNFSKTIGDVNLLSNPRIRVRNNEKAKIQVGDKVPIITSTAAVNAGVAESVQYIDVGLTLNIQPRISIDGYVNIDLALEVSSLGDRTTSPNGTVAFTIGTRNTSTILRLKDNETQVLAGLISDEERKNASRIPGIGDIPIIGRLFANQEDNKRKTEIVLAITPRILSNIQRPEGEATEYWSGTQNLITDKLQISFPPDDAPLRRSPQSSIIERPDPSQVQPIQNVPEVSPLETPSVTPIDNQKQENNDVTPTNSAPANTAPINVPTSTNTIKPFTPSSTTANGLSPEAAAAGAAALSNAAEVNNAP
jgi:general secretion pathway protein D